MNTNVPSAKINKLTGQYTLKLMLLHFLQCLAAREEQNNIYFIYSKPKTFFKLHKSKTLELGFL